MQWMEDSRTVSIASMMNMCDVKSDMFATRRNHPKQEKFSIANIANCQDPKWPMLFVFQPPSAILAIASNHALRVRCKRTVGSVNT